MKGEGEPRLRAVKKVSATEIQEINAGFLKKHFLKRLMYWTGVGVLSRAKQLGMRIKNTPSASPKQGGIGTVDDRSPYSCKIGQPPPAIPHMVRKLTKTHRQRRPHLSRIKPINRKVGRLLGQDKCNAQSRHIPTLYESHLVIIGHAPNKEAYPMQHAD